MGLKNFFISLACKKIPLAVGVIIIIAVALAVVFLVKKSAFDTSGFEPNLVSIKMSERKTEEENPETGKKPEFKYVYTPVPISMKEIKTKGCVTDGILSGYGADTDNSVDMVNRSNCAYLHRALETWADTPDFEKASRIMERIKKPGIVYGMFIAEAIKTNKDYPNGKDEDGNFDFRKMCRKGSENVWGEHTCKPEMSSKEYRKYLTYITRKAMNLGIQSFLFGQIYYQDYDGPKKDRMQKVVKEMREYAEKKNMEIIIGAQTGTITDEKYLRMFDYIEGGVGMGEDGWVETGPCWSHLESCWALLWNDRYASRANNVLLHLDWSGLSFDDMSVFARMDKSERTEVLKRLHSYFTSKNMGFLMPMMATINRDDDGCHGPKKKFYSASNAYTCQDEGIINSILGET